MLDVLVIYPHLILRQDLSLYTKMIDVARLAPLKDPRISVSVHSSVASSASVGVIDTNHQS